MHHSTSGATDLLDAYFARIGYLGPRVATLQTLHAIHRLHPQSIPFENLDPFLGRPVQLDLASLQEKLLNDRRGGYCYEHNMLLKHVLQRLGYRVRGLAARVVWNTHAVLPRTHMLLLVAATDEQTADGLAGEGAADEDLAGAALAGEAWIADVGFGGSTLTAPLRLVDEVQQNTPHEPFRLCRQQDEYELQAHLRGQWHALYRFDLQRQLLPDYELTNWYLSHHPESRFVTNLIAARVEPARRYALLNGELAIHELHGATIRRRLATLAALKAVLQEVFGIMPPATPGSDGLLARIVEGTDYTVRPAADPPDADAAAPTDRH